MQLLLILKGMGRRFPYHFLTAHLHPFLVRGLIQFLALQFLVRRGLREILPQPRSPFMPARMHVSASPSMALAVSAQMYGWWIVPP